MTSDAKIGLLLGLVFIFIIAFVINGLPGLHKKDDGNKLTTNMVGLQNSQTGLGANERRVALQAPEAVQPVENTPPPPPAQADDSPQTRFSMALPQDAPATAATAEGAASTPTTIPAAVPTSRDAGAAPTQPVVKTEAARPAATKVYVVQDGDTLSSIAKKVYGDTLGNKLATINAIFEANRKTLASADSLQVGQKLTMPALAVEKAAANSPSSVLSGKNFTKAESVGQRHNITGADKAATPTKTEPAKSGRIYVVREGDSLWRIAAAQLGDGNRYKEIVRLNADKLTSEDDIQVDMQLKLPAK